MTWAQFFHDAGFWQWVGMIALAGALASFRPVVIKRRCCRNERDAR